MKAFTLLELLVVIAIIAILIALIGPAVGGIGRANNLTVATQNFIAQINRARQEALTRNRSVEFQLLSASRPEAAETAAYRAMRYIICDEFGSSSGSNAFPNKTMWLPQAVVIISDSSRSDLSPTLTQTNNVALPGGITANNGVFFTIRPNGMITTATAANTLQWTLTSAYGDTNNFSTIQIDTRTGITRLFRP